jgi:hypothetical protein
MRRFSGLWGPDGWFSGLLGGLLGVALAQGSGAVNAQPTPAAPPPPAYYQAEVRYRIPSAREQHVALFRDLVAHLERAGFQFLPPLAELPPTLPADPTQDVLTGRVPAARVPQLTAHPAVASVLLLPPDYRLPDNPEQLVPVQLELRAGYPTAQQRQVRQQVLVLLQHFGFREAIGYDSRGRSGLPYTRLRGALPASQLRVPFYDLRYQPNGWFGPRLQEPPEPLRRKHPVLWTEVLPSLAVPTVPQLPPERSAPEEKIREDLWQRLQERQGQKEFLRVEIILQTAPPAELPWEKLLHQAAPDLFLEGRLGQVVTARLPAEQVRALARLPLVSALRLPEDPQESVAAEAAAVGDNQQFLEQTGLAAWHRRHFRGQKVRIALLDSDFRGAAAWVQAGKLPARTQLLDLTRLRQPQLEPEPYPTEGPPVGHGTCCARAVALAAPEAELILIRLDPQAPYLLREVLDWIRGQEVSSAYLRQRANELYAEATLVRRQWEEVLRERKKVLEDFTDEREYQLRYGFLGPVRAWLFSRHEWHQQRLAEARAAEAAYLARQRRFDQLLEQLRGLRGTPLVVCPWVWQVGWALGQRSPLTEELDALLRPAALLRAATTHPHSLRTPFVPLWLNAAGNTAGQVLSGWLPDPTGDGPLALLPASAPLPAGLWTRTLAFLAWQPYQGEKSAELPAGLRLRLALQWTEAHDPAYFARPGEPDPYLEPLAQPRLTVLRQRDPAGQQAPADDLLAVAQTAGRPQRLDNAPDSATYELTLEFQVPVAGRYAVQVEQPPAEQWVLLPVEGGRAYRLQRLVAPARDGIRPLEAATLPAIEKKWLFTPRLLVMARGGAAALLGRPVWRDAATAQGTVGVPAEGRYVVAVGAVDPAGRPEPYSAPGPPQGLGLFPTPRLLAPDRLDLGVRGPALGTSLSAAVSAGAAATLLSGGWSLEQVRQFFLDHTTAHVLRLPPPPEQPTP